MPNVIRRRGKDLTLWEITVPLGGFTINPLTGKKKPNVDTVQFRGSRADAKKYRRELLVQVEAGTFVQPSTITLNQFMEEFLPVIKPTLTPGSYARYEGIYKNYIVPSAIGQMPLQQIRPTHVEAYFNTPAIAAQSMSSKLTHLIVLRRVFRKAVRDHIIRFDPTADLENKPKVKKGASASKNAKKHCWTAEEAQAFLAFVKEHGSVQDAAFYAVALDSGARKNELCGLRWTDIDFATSEIAINGQLRITFVSKGSDPKDWFGPTKGKLDRKLKVSAATMLLLRAHRQAQNEFKMKHRVMYQDHGLVFAKELGHLRTRKDCLGFPLQSNNLGERSFAPLCASAGVRRIKFHGLRHTCATLLLRAGRPIHVVAQRLGHSDVSITHNTYAHVLPDQQQDAADAIGSVIHGSR